VIVGNEQRALTPDRRGRGRFARNRFDASGRRRGPGRRPVGIVSHRGRSDRLQRLVVGLINTGPHQRVLDGVLHVVGGRPRVGGDRLDQLRPIGTVAVVEFGHRLDDGDLEIDILGRFIVCGRFVIRDRLVVRFRAVGFGLLVGCGC